MRQILALGAFAGAFLAAVASAVTWDEGSAAARSLRPVADRGAAAMEQLPVPAGLVWPTPIPSPPLAPARATAGFEAAAAPAPPAPAPRAAGVGIGSYQQVLINQDRAAAGLPPLTWSSCLAGVADQQASRMAAQGGVSHSDGISEDLGCHVGPVAGENLGYWTGGIDDPQLNSMFMASPEHRANILGSFRYVGTRWVIGPNGTAYLAVEFD